MRTPEHQSASRISLTLFRKDFVRLPVYPCLIRIEKCYLLVVAQKHNPIRLQVLFGGKMFNRKNVNLPVEAAGAAMMRRRKITLGLLFGIGVAINPWISKSGKFFTVKPAEAVWLQVAMLALSAISAFSRQGDGGVGAFLQNIKSLSEENIHLTQEVLKRMGELQADIDELPARMREVFIEIKGYELRQNTQKILDIIRVVEERYRVAGKISERDRLDCQRIIDTCVTLTAARSVPYGRGGTAAACAPMIGAIEARAWYLLGRRSDFRLRVNVAYLPWFDEMLTDQDGSLQRSFEQAATDLANTADHGLSGLPDSLRRTLDQTWKSALGIDPGQSTASAQLACGGYSRHTGDKAGPCSQRICDPGFTSTDPKIQVSLKSNELAQSHMEKTILAGGENYSLRPIRCYCDEWASIPTYTTEAGATFNAKLTNAQNESEPPRLILNGDWVSTSNASTCSIYASGEEGDPNKQFTSVRDSSNAAQIRQQLNEWVNGPLAKFNDQRAIVYATYVLLDSVRGSREQFKRLVS